MRKYIAPAVAVCLVAGICGSGFAAVPWATSIVSYDYDGDGNPANDDPDYSHPASALGEPARMGGVGTEYEQVVSMFSGPWTGQEVVRVAPGGHLVVGFDQPITNASSHLYGSDFIVFGNAFFMDTSWPSGQMGESAILWDGPGQISVSGNGTDWYLVPGVAANSLFPTQGYMDSGPYDTKPGHVPTDFCKPVNPALTAASFDGLSYAQALALYDGSGGGAPADIGLTGLDEVRYVRVTVPEGALYSVVVDGFSVVPEPASLLLLACAAAGVLLRRRG